MTKQQCRDIAPENYKYAGYWDDLYHFTTGNQREGYLATSCNEEDLSNGNLEYMAKHNLTRANIKGV